MLERSSTASLAHFSKMSFAEIFATTASSYTMPRSIAAFGCHIRFSFFFFFFFMLLINIKSRTHALKSVRMSRVCAARKSIKSRR